MPMKEWRGLMLDSSRHFIPLEELTETYLPLMAQAQMNVLHLHLTDGPGWRWESKAYPRLTTVGAWRVDQTDRPWNWCATEFWTPAAAAAGLKKYGGFYSAQALQTLQSKARALNIQVVPELDVPGHSAALLMAYPEFACPTNRDPKQWFLGKDVLCIGNPDTLKMLDSLIGELCVLFPDAPIHIGCDEVPRAAWDECPRCCNPETQKQFYRALIDCVRKRGRTVLAWDDLQHVGIDLSAVSLLCWHDDVRPRRQDIACPYSYCYLDQAASRKALPRWQPPREARGIQVNLWTEEMPTRDIRTQCVQEGLSALRSIFQASAAMTPTPPKKEASHD